VVLVQSVSPAAGEPIGGDHVKSDDAADDVAGLGFKDREKLAALGQS
jgi:hypothetical protein